MYGCKSWTIKKAEHWRIDAFELWCWRRLLRIPWTARRSNQPILKEISTEYSLEGLIWKWSSSPLAIWCKELTYWKRPWCWKRLKVGGEGDDRGWDGCWMASPTQWTEFEQALGFVDGQRGLACCSSWGHKKLYTTEQLNWSELTSLIVNLLNYFIWQSGLIITSVDKKQITPIFSSSRQQTSVISLIFWG